MKTAAATSSPLALAASTTSREHLTAHLGRRLRYCVHAHDLAGANQLAAELADVLFVLAEAAYGPQDRGAA